MSDNLLGILIIEVDSSEEAQKRANIMKKCPRLLASGTSGNKFYSIYMVPRGNEWWLNYPELFPEERSKVHIIENVVYPEASKTITPTESPPCGADCGACPFKEEYGCPGCPAVIGKV